MLIFIGLLFLRCSKTRSYSACATARNSFKNYGLLLIDRGIQLSITRSVCRGMLPATTCLL